MKQLLLGLFLAALCAFPAHAQAAIPPTNCYNVAIASAPATEVTGNNPNVAISSNVWFVSVMNLDTSATVCCSQSSSVSCGSSTTIVNPILPQSVATAPYNYLGWLIIATEPWYCANSSGSGTTRASVCTFK